MNKNFKARAISLILCIATAFTLSSCGAEVDEDTSFVTPEIEPFRIEATVGGSVSTPSEFIMPTDAGRMSVGYTGTQMYGGFYLITTRTTDYFTVSGPITVSLNANMKRLIDKEYKDYKTDDKYSKVAVALFRKDGDFSQYIATAYFLANNETHQATFEDIDPAAEYRFVISYTDVSRVRVTGQFTATGITTAPIPIIEDDSTTAEKA